MGMNATYSPEDNKLRLYSSARLEPETYARVRAAGFIWAPKQQLFVAPMWTPEREDVLLDLCGEIGDEETTLEERAEQRAERFEGHSASRARDAHEARARVAAIADGIPFGQPILVGHHSERRARKDAERIRAGMDKAVSNWKTSKYWIGRAEGARAHANYKAIPEVRLRRIKGLEADARKFAKNLKGYESRAKWWARDVTGEDIAKWARAFYSQVVCDDGEKRSLDTAWEAGQVSLQNVVGQRREEYRLAIEHTQRWLDHTNNRIAYERAMLGPYKEPEKPKRELAPAVNWRGPNFVEITSEMWAAIGTQHKGYRKMAANAEHGAYRQPMALAVLLKNKGADTGNHYPHTFAPVFITDAKTKERPAADLEKLNAAHDAALQKAHSETLARAKRREANAAREAAERAADAPFDAIAQTLKSGGVQVVSANQLFPTPYALADRMADMTRVRAGERVLEPSAGTGALLQALRRQMPHAQPVCVEIRADLCQRLRSYGGDVDVRNADFLQCNGDLGKFDVVLMNPPFENGSDIKHILHARKFLKPGGRLAAICANGPRQAEQLQPLADSWEELPAGTFAGTGVRTVLLTMSAADE